MKSSYIKPLSIIIISCVGIIVYFNTFHCSFHLDDQDITDNFAIRNIHHLSDIWAFYPCRFVTLLSLALNYHFHQLDVFGYHVFNLMVHLVTAILVWWLTLLTLSTPAFEENSAKSKQLGLLKEQRITQHANLMALLAGLVFVSHPLQTEAVTYIWQRAASMATLLYLASLSFYVQSRLLQDGQSSLGTGRLYYIFSLITAVAAMFTKEIAVTLPLMILLYEFSFFETKKNLDGRRIFPFLLTLFIIPLTMWLTRSSLFHEIQDVSQGPGGISPMHYLLTQFRVMVTYIRLVFLPLNQNLDYDYPVFKSIFEWPVFISFLFLITILFCAKRLFLKYRLVSFSIFWFFLTLLPESSLLPAQDIIFEHRLYLPLVGYSMFLVSGVYYLLEKNTIKTTVMVLTMIIACNAVLTYQRNKVWENDFTLWDDAVRKSPHKARPYDRCGIFYYKQGNLPQALRAFNKAIAINPNYDSAYNNRGLIYYNQGHWPQALSDYHKAIAINPKYPAYFNLGLIHNKQGYFTQALWDYSKEIEVTPGQPEPFINRGNIYTREGNFPQAIADYNRAIEINPQSAEAFYDRGVVWDKQGHLTQAISDYNKAIEINPKFPEAFYNLAFIYYRLKEYDKAWSNVHQAEGLGASVDPNFINELKKASGREQ